MVPGYLKIFLQEENRLRFSFLIERVLLIELWII
ncbi:hypothetical protein SpiGrapes_1699 [Sphaerochaeta pleomorpha str. Grapes]|uniref:Uncharacterized protein n=1 Tax=Sphaerochaeta pleomorpha (strain ATCC BAA-1885 / DSM 22778 / Grapes) TaxID=158190 RepID=G8QWZ4_SPHPG|nr:hypothetical protein SpiGrapes_1699 [Sphaerochaeta pleomorpha str. Grapes]